MRAVRSWIFVLSVAGRRLRHRVGPALLVGVGIAAAGAMLAAVSAGALLAQTRSLERDVTRIAEADRAVRALWFGVPRDTAWERLDAEARSALAGVSGRDLVTTVRYRQTQIGGDLVDLAAGDRIARWVDLTAGRVPERCRPERCEVVQVAGSGDIPSVPGLRLVRVGEGRIASGLALGELPSREADPSVIGSALRYHTAESPPFLVAEGVGDLARLEPLAAIFRSYGWTLPLAAADARPWEVERLMAAVTRARSDLGASSPLYDVTAPTAELEQGRRRAETGARRLLLVGGTAAALLLAFAVLAASSLRRDAEAAQRRLTWLGSRRWQLATVAAAESAAFPPRLRISNPAATASAPSRATYHRFQNSLFVNVLELLEVALGGDVGPAYGREMLYQHGGVLRAEELREQTEARERERGARERQIAELRQRQRLHHELDRAFSDLRADLNAALRPDIAELASGFLADLTDGRYDEVDLNENYDLTVLDDGLPKTVVSGGEEDLTNLVLRLAISQMIAERAGQPLSLLVLDEIFGALDEPRRQGVLRLLRHVGDRFPQVILITHIEQVREGLDRVIRVEYDAARGTSVVKDETATLGGADAGVAA